MTYIALEIALLPIEIPRTSMVPARGDGGQGFVTDRWRIRVRVFKQYERPLSSFVSSLSTAD